MSEVDKIIAEANTFPEGGSMVICTKCHKAHVRGEGTYIAIAGNIYLGEGGLVGNAFNRDGKVEQMEVLCTRGCAREFFEEYILSYAEGRGKDEWRRDKCAVCLGEENENA